MLTHKEAEIRVERGFWVHFAVYLVVTGSLVALNFSRNPDHPWSLWMAAGWGIGVAAHAIAFLMPESRARMITRTILRMDRRQSRLARTSR
ncbi:MAG TPA: 2TM domain-containing protein [Planctomycetaceae bacterium]|nr:2TM domain-containing protein [Planctomycetaceae bacterium]